MELRYLKAFLTTAKLSSFSNAAKELGIAQSAISRQIKLLEESIGHELIVRSSKKVVLTHKGQELYLIGEKFVNQTSELFLDEKSVPIRVGILQGLLKGWFSKVITEFQAKHDRDIQIEIADLGQLHRGIESGQYDIVISIENFQTDLISSLKLFNEEAVIISKEPLNQALHHYRWITYGPKDNLYQIAKEKSKRITEVSDLPTITSMVRSGAGIAVIPSHSLKESDSSLVITPIRDFEMPKVFMTTMNFKVIPSHIALLRNFILENIDHGVTL